MENMPYKKHKDKNMLEKNSEKMKAEITVFTDDQVEFSEGTSINFDQKRSF